MAEVRVRRVGDRVERPAHRWTPAVHLLLARLAERVGEAVPRPIALHGAMETVTWLAGDSGPDGWQHVVPEEGLRSMAVLLRRLHEASRGFVLPPGLAWADERAPRSGEVVCHGDFGPWNLAWVGGRAAGAFDWDLAYAGAALDDVAYALEYVAPFRSDEESMRWLRHPVPPARPARMRAFWSAYTGRPEAAADLAALVEAVLERQVRARDLAARLAAEGVEPQATWMREGLGLEMAARVDWTRANRALLLDGERSQPDAPGSGHALG